MLRIVALGTAAVALAALSKRGSKPKRTKRKTSKRSASGRTLQHTSEGQAAAEPIGVVQEVQPSGGGQLTAASNELPPQLALKLLRLLLSILFSVLLHAVFRKGTPWTSILLSSSALFILTEFQQQDVGRGGVRKQAATPVTIKATDAPAQTKVVPAAVQDFNGLWIKDKEASDSMEAAFELMRMNGLLRKAIRLIKGVHIRQSSSEFELSVLSGILWFKVTERYPLDGSQCSWKRRDLRRGKHLGSVDILPNGALRNQMTWPDPCGGTGADTYFTPSPTTLWVDTVLCVGGETVRYRQVYCKHQ